MDLFATDQLNTTRWKYVKLVAFVFFGLACCLLGASLVLSQPETNSAGRGAQPYAATQAN